MAIDRVESAFNGSQRQLNAVGIDLYTGSHEAPGKGGEYGLRVSAYDDGGNVTTTNQTVSVTKWHTPKTNWQPTDPVNIEDYNRIKNNLEFLQERATELYATFDIQDMGADKTSYKDYYYADEFNRFEQNLDSINKNIFTQDYGPTVRFFDNGPFIDYVELNRIEGAILNMNEILDNLEAGLARLSFRLGNWKGVKI